MRDYRRYVRDSHRYDAAFRNANHERLRSVHTGKRLRCLDCVRNGRGPPVERELGSKFRTSSAGVAVIWMIIQKLNPWLLDRQDAGPSARH